MSEPRFKMGDEVRKVGDATTYRVTAIGPKDRRDDQEPWYSLKGPEPERFIKPFADAFERELESAA